MSRNIRTVKSRLNNFANFLVMVMVVALLIFTVYLARQNRRASHEYKTGMFTAEKKIRKLQHTINKKDFLIEHLKSQLKQLRRQEQGKHR